jgi:hypothetical protein
MGFEQVCRYRKLWNLNVVFKPIFLGGVMQATQNKASTSTALLSCSLTRAAMLSAASNCARQRFKQRSLTRS